MSHGVTFILFKYQRQRAQVTHMPAKAITMNIYMSTIKQHKALYNREIKMTVIQRECKITSSTVLAV